MPQGDYEQVGARESAPQAEGEAVPVPTGQAPAKEGAEPTDAAPAAEVEV